MWWPRCAPACKWLSETEVAYAARLTGKDEPLRTGRFVVSCEAPAPVYVDGAYMGVCPLDMPLIAGPHTMTVKRRGRAGKTVEFRVAPAR